MRMSQYPPSSPGSSTLSCREGHYCTGRAVLSQLTREQYVQQLHACSTRDAACCVVHHLCMQHLQLLQYIACSTVQQTNVLYCIIGAVLIDGCWLLCTVAMLAAAPLPNICAI